jgi:glycosyltransferase involved in cell wall biosynthesis
MRVMGLPVSVVITCYNHRRFIEEAVMSALAQLPPPKEVCVVDDGSQDGSYEALAAFVDRVRLLAHEGRGNKGQSASLNVGIVATDAPFIAFMDSDDYWYPGKLARQVELLARFPEVGVVYTSGHAVDQNGERSYALFPDTFEERNDPSRLLVDNYISAGMSSVMVRRSCIEDVGLFDTQLRWSKDHDMWLRLIEHTRFAYIPAPLMAYRRHSTNISLGRGQWDEGFRVLDRAARRFPYPRRAVRARAAVLHYRLAKYDWTSGNRRGAMLGLIRAGTLDPVRSAAVVLESALSVLSSLRSSL